MQDLISSSTNTILTTIFNSEFLHWIAAELMQLWREHRFYGVYKVREYYVTLELMDQEGNLALYTKQEKIIFLQDGVSAIQDQAWGDGGIFKNYTCSPGIVVDKYQEGYRWNVLISLRRTYRRGDEQDLIIQRTIEGGFTTPNETFQVQVDHPMKAVTLNIIFPQSRLPKQIFVVENNLKRSYLLSEEHQTKFPDGRLGYTWRLLKPRLFEGYILKWDW